MRNTFGFFLGACEYVGWSYGKRMRAWFVTEVQKLKAPDLAVECSGSRRVRLALRCPKDHSPKALHAGMAHVGGALAAS